jgi:GNAT superfamily N-acetyltransferase
MEPEIRKANIKDLQNIQGLNLQLFKNEHKKFDSTLDCNWTYSDSGTDYFKERVTKDDACAFVAIYDKRIVGYLVGAIVAPKEVRVVGKMAELENMFVLPKYQRFGIGTLLLNKFRAWCKSKRVVRLRTVASAQNSQGINFYHKNGFSDYDLVLEQDV